MTSRSRGLSPQPPRHELRTDGALLGWIEITGGDHTWVLGRLIEGPAFVRHAPLFERWWALAQELDAGDDALEGLAFFELHDQFSAAQARIDALALTLDGQPIHDFKVELVESLPVEFRYE